MKKTVLKSTGVPVSIVGSISKSTDTFEFTMPVSKPVMVDGIKVGIESRQQSGPHTTPRPVVTKAVPPTHVRVIIHHPTHNEMAVVKRSSLAEVEAKA